MATTSVILGSLRKYTTQGTAGDGNVLILTDDISRYDVFELHATQGNFTVEASLDGTNWTNAIQLEDRGQTTLTFVTTGVNGPLYATRVKANALRVKQSGGIDLVATLICGNCIGA